jgi:hypothetical protein
MRNSNDSRFTQTAMMTLLNEFRTINNGSSFLFPVTHAGTRRSNEIITKILGNASKSYGRLEMWECNGCLMIDVVDNTGHASFKSFKFEMKKVDAHKAAKALHSVLSQLKKQKILRPC